MPSQALTPLRERSQGPWDSHCPCQDPQASALSPFVQPPTSEKGEAAPRNKAGLVPLFSDHWLPSETLLPQQKMHSPSTPTARPHGACHRDRFGNLNTQWQCLILSPKLTLQMRKSRPTYRAETGAKPFPGTQKACISIHLLAPGVKVPPRSSPPRSPAPPRPT